MSTRNEHRQRLADMTDEQLHAECVRRIKLASYERRRRSKDTPNASLDELCCQEADSRDLNLYERALVQAAEELAIEAKEREGRK